MKTVTMMARIGTQCLGLTYARYAGIPPSLDQAHVRRETEAMLARLTLKDTTKRPVIIAVVAPFDPVMARRMARTGEEALRASSTEPMETKMTQTMMKPKQPFMKMDQNMARGTADLALRVSSLMWIALSNPVKLHTQVNIPRFYAT